MDFKKAIIGGISRDFILMNDEEKEILSRSIDILVQLRNATNKPITTILTDLVKCSSLNRKYHNVTIKPAYMVELKEYDDALTPINKIEFNHINWMNKD